MSFANLGLSEEILRAVSERGYTEPTPIQGAGNSCRVVRPRPDGRCTDRHRQDCRFHTAHPATSFRFRKTHNRQSTDPRAGTYPYARTGRVARGGETVRASIVETVSSNVGEVLWSAPEAETRRVIATETAEQLQAMMMRTVSEGTSYRAFHDGQGRAFLPGIPVAGKTGTLTDGDTQRYYTWFTGFAPAHAEAGAGQVAVAALVVNGPAWEIKANVLARDLLRARLRGEEALFG